MDQIQKSSADNTGIIKIIAEELNELKKVNVVCFGIENSIANLIAEVKEYIEKNALPENDKNSKGI